MIRAFQNCCKNDVLLVGGKCASLGEMIGAGKNVPPGFAVTVNAYKHFVQETGIDKRIFKAMNEIGLDQNGDISFQEATKIIAPIVQSTPMPQDLVASIQLAYENLSSKCGKEDVLVAVRSSATMEDAADASYAGQHETYLNISGLEEVLERIKECWASLFSAPALHYRSSKDVAYDDALMAVGVQKMVNSRSAGVAFTVDPVTGDRSKIIIEGAWGLGEGVVSGYVTPDHFAVDRDSFEILENWISPKTIEYVRDPITGSTITRAVEESRQSLPSLSKDEIIQLAKMAISIEQHYGRPQDIEWSIDADLASSDKGLLILQSRPVTIWGGIKAVNAC
ncbi:MAG: hypothetical protein APF81_18075 [Desulfosporosinus sp. BRH_c37]|nr:MAG: hypothetical protein APF81_18075 [Desulfosporosinus sp. BRH_c37]